MPDDLDALLAAAVQGVGGTPREGQTRMAHAVQDALSDKSHLLAQAGTGTGKSLAYLVPAIAHAVESGRPAIIATATLALQAQIVDRDLPRIADALAPVIGRRPTYGLVKGRRNYVCVNKLQGGYPDDEDEGLLSVGDVDQQAGRLGREVLRLREWAEETDSGDRDDLVPGVSERAWRQVSVSALECLGSKCPMVAECFVEQARAHAKDCDVVVTNHSFMAIDAFEGRRMLPEHDLLVIDEGHELVDRVTSTVTDELSGGMASAAARRCGRLADTAALTDAGEFVQGILDRLAPGRLTGIPDDLALGLGRVRDTAREVSSQLKPEQGAAPDGGRQMAQAAVDELFDTAARVLEERELDVAWISEDLRRGHLLRVAPMSVAMALREAVFGERTVVLTSATLELGGSFDAVAGTLGLRGAGGPSWTGLDVGSPFDYPTQAIAYVASQLPPPGRDGPADAVFDEIETLVRAAGGRTLGLFSSTRAAKAAAEAMRTRLGDEIPVLCQGDDQIATLVRQFAADGPTCLFGTMSLWQGVDVPGSACQLVIIDRIPFPRPDDPLSSARTEAIARRGGNGFMAVSATHAALRLAQGAGRLIRRADDRGVVAFLDPRMVTARYAGFLQSTLPPFWPTSDRALVLNALRRLDETAGPVIAVAARGGAEKASPVAVVRDDDTSAHPGPSVAGPVEHPAPDDLAAPNEPVAPDPQPTPAGHEPEPALSARPSGQQQQLLDQLRAQVAQVEEQPLAQPSIMPLGAKRPKAPDTPPSAPPAVPDGAQEPADVTEAPGPGEVPGPPEPRALRVVTDGGERVWSAEDDEELRDGAEMGLNVTELAEHLDLPTEELRARAGVLGVRLDE
ncbi:ATP-dependent DNA helicase [Allobranchiibius huperziae]|uniref:ATP-dependent helicase DinG n=1 Tax=Allobranchiibius huperziae TaxID=1874116 RepID=A0A853DGP2_9MICO|nr:ATP-dependent DNA helicase [Allobranchiibius huperziae]NYJ75193.1 ATP-dependent DNA helicase DinG [Allobranchiibius huperziae]